MENQKDDRQGTNAPEKPGRRWARKLGLLSGLILSGVAAGFVFGEALAVDTPPPTYCSYAVTGLQGATVAFLQAHGWEAGLTAHANNSGYVCEPCSGVTVSCGAAPAFPAGVPNPPLVLNQINTTCGACVGGI